MNQQMRVAVSPDGVFDNTIVELKSPYDPTFHVSHMAFGNVKKAWKWQCQMQLIGSGAERHIFATYDPRAILANNLHYDEQREHNEQAQPAAPQANKYDRTILGKYGSGKCTVDVYRVLNAFPSGSPEIDHALKKLLAPGKRGVKSELQDLKEAIQSIEARISYLSDQGEK